MMRDWVALAAAAVFSAGCGSTGASFGTGSNASFVSGLAPPQQSGGATQVAGRDYRIGPMDTIDVVVFQVDDLSKTVQVDSGGKILLPLVGEMTASGRTAEELSNQIEAQLAKTYVRDPQVSVTVKEATSQMVTVDGAVMQPGQYPIVGNTTLLKAVALARGPDPREANIRKVAIFRQQGGQRTAAMFDLAAIRQGKAEDPQVFADDVIVVETSGTKSFLRDFGGFIPFVNFFRPY